MSPEINRHKGFAIVSAIFIIVVLAALGGFIATVSTTQHVGSALDLQGARAYQAARAGTEWGIAQTTNPLFCTNNPSSNIGVVNGISVTVLCRRIATGDVVEVGLGSIYQVTAIACSQPDVAGACPGDAAAPNYVERRLVALVER
jgi:MSHA biogenesis protein MshP